jgi:ATP-binding cassette subfamily A (ABC1) protein 3
MGCRTLPYWLGTFCFDYLIYLCFIVIFYTISATLNLEIAFKYFWSGFSCFILFGFSYILYAYLIGFLFKTLESALKLYAMFCFFVSFSIPFISIACVDFFYQKFDNNEIIRIVIYVL